MTVKLITELLCQNCGKPRSSHGKADECPTKNGFSKKSQYCNGDDKGWCIDSAMRNAHLERYVDTPMDPPTVKWQVGDKVTYGNWDDSIVEAVFENGLKIVVSSAPKKMEDWELRRGEVQRKSRVYRAMWWFDLSKAVYGNAFKYFKSASKIYYSQHSLWEIIRRSLENRFDPNPDYQRGYVWTQEDKLRFIESVFDEGSDLGKFIFVSYEWPRNHIEILDGKQRINAIKEFCLSKFPYKGTYWHELSRLDRHAFTDRLIQSAKLDGNKMSKAELLTTFLKVNAAGVPQNEEHLAHVKKLLADEAKN